MKKETGEWSKSRERKKREIMTYFPVLGYLKRLPVVFVFLFYKALFCHFSCFIFVLVNVLLVASNRNKLRSAYARKGMLL